MKKIILIVLIFSSLNLFSQSTCVYISAINEYATTNLDPNGNYFEINWNNNLLSFSCENFDSRIEIFNDNMTNPNTGLPYEDDYPNNPDGNSYCSSYTIDQFYSIDFYNDSSLVIMTTEIPGKCFWWRIIIEGSSCIISESISECLSATEWHFIEFI